MQAHELIECKLVANTQQKLHIRQGKREREKREEDVCQRMGEGRGE